MSKERVCIAGATGHLGTALVEELRSRDADVVAVARNSSSSNVSKLREIDGVSVEFVDASKPEESYATALASATTAISCLAAGYKYIDRYSDFWAIDRDATIRFGREAITAGVKHLLLVSTFEGKDSRAVSAFSNAKEEAVDVLRDECQRMGVTFTVLRPNAYFKDLTDRAFDHVLKEGRYTVLGSGCHRINPIAREDVAVFISDCIERKREGEYFLGGQDIFTFREIGSLAAQVIGVEQELEIRSVPLWRLRLISVFMGLFGWLSRRARRQAAILNWMIYISTHDGVAPCYGKRRLVDEYKRKFNEYKQERNANL